MTKQADLATTLWALDVLRRYAPAALETGPAPRHYAPPPAADFHVECFRRQCERDQALREAMGYDEQEPAYERDAAEFFAAEQSPSDRTFR